eukprot:s5210_g1.t1
MPAEMTEVDYNPDVQTEVPPVPAGTPIVVEETPKETEEPETPVPAASSVKPKVKAMPKKTIGKRKTIAAKAKAVAVKKMPRPASKRVKQEVSESGKHVRGTFHIRQAEKNRKRRLAWKSRQRDAMAYFEKRRKEEESRPAESISVERTGQGRVVRRKTFNPASGKRETMQITVGDGNTKMNTAFKGFSQKPVSQLRCGHCEEFGHIISMCPMMARRVSLTQGAVVLTPRTGTYETPTAASEAGVEDNIRPDDSISTVAANLTAESLRAHNRRLRGHAWDALPPKFSSGQSTEVKSAAAIAKGPKPAEPRPPSYPPPGWKPSQAMPAVPPAPPTPPPIPAPLPPPSTPPPKEKPMPVGEPQQHDHQSKPLQLQHQRGRQENREQPEREPAAGVHSLPRYGTIAHEDQQAFVPPAVWKYAYVPGCSSDQQRGCVSTDRAAETGNDDDDSVSL